MPAPDFSRSYDRQDYKYTLERIGGNTTVTRQFLSDPRKRSEKVLLNEIPEDLLPIVRQLNNGELPPADL